MALIKCIECGNEISDKSTQCIHCGCPIEEIKVLYCEECGNIIKANDEYCKKCGCPTSTQKEETKVITKNTKKTQIVYENLTNQQIKKVITYRKNTSQLYIGARVVNLILVVVGMFAFVFGFFTLGLSLLIYIICVIVTRGIIAPKIIKEDKEWFENNFDKLIEQNILKAEELNNNRQKTYDELNYYDLNKIKSYRKVNNEYKIKSRKKYLPFIILYVISFILTLCLILIFIPVLFFSIIMFFVLLKKTKEEDKQWYEENKQRLYNEKQLPFK